MSSAWRGHIPVFLYKLKYLYAVKIISCHLFGSIPVLTFEPPPYRFRKTAYGNIKSIIVGDIVFCRNVFIEDPIKVFF